MSRNLRSFSKALLGCGLALVMLAPPGGARARTLYAFQGGSTDGAFPYAGVIMDSVGNLYGTTWQGAGGNCGGYTCGTVFKLAPGGTETVIHRFSGGSDGANPLGALIMDSAGDLYGTTWHGGGGICVYGCGTIFRIAVDGTETILHSFAGGSDGSQPYGAPLQDRKGNLYGTTSSGGSHDQGTVYKFSADGTKTVLYSFAGRTDGANPNAGVVMDKAGNLYGTTLFGGNTNCSVYGCGTIYRLAADGTETILYSFAGGIDGATPYAGLVIDKAGNLYGTTGEGGGDIVDCDSTGCGTVFKLAPDGTESVLHAFTRGADGAYPYAGLIIDSTGNLFGTTQSGGGSKKCDEGGGCGTVFQLAPDGTETVLLSFGRRDSRELRGGSSPLGGLILSNGRLYGTTEEGGDLSCDNAQGCGVIFEMKK